MVSLQDYYVEQVATGRLSEFSYYIESAKQAVIIDPIREPDVYLNLAHQRGAEIKYILETHYHSDFVSGHLELARKAGAKVIFGPNAKPGFSCYEAKDGESFQFGKIKIKVLHTPGHTIESTCYLLLEASNRPRFLFTGDTLYINDIGRLDLAANFSNIPEKELAEHLYDSLHDKIIPLPDGVLVCPSHGDAAKLGNDTLGNAKRAIHELMRMSKDTFVQTLLLNVDTPPSYAINCAKKNKHGYATLEAILGKSLRPFTLEEFKKARLEGHTIIDTRDPADIQKGFIPGSITISLKTNFEAWIATLLNYTHKISLVTDPGKEKETITKLARIGFENVEGYLDGGYKAWVKAGNPIQRYNNILGRQLKDRTSDRCQMLDVRQESEWNGGVIEGSQLISLSELEIRLQEIPKDKTIYVYCKLGGRSLIAYSILTKNGFQNVYDIKGGLESAKRAGIPLIIPMLFS